MFSITKIRGIKKETSKKSNLGILNHTQIHGFKDFFDIRLGLSIIFVPFDIHAKLECRILPDKPFGSC